MIRFGMQCGVAQIWEETSSEDGWVIKYNRDKHLFLIWCNGESEAIGNPHSHTRKNLESVFDLIESFT